MAMYTNLCVKLTLFLSLLVSLTAVAQPNFDGMGRTADWTDLENASNEMPATVWGTCDATSEDRVGIRVDFDDGTSGSATYSGVSGLWNSSFSGLSPDTVSGFLTSCTGMHFLYNNGVNLPMAWENCNMVYASNFDLDYSEQNGSHFRATTTGWVSARIQTYCGSGAPSAPAQVPAVPLAGLIALGLLLPLAGIVGLARRKVQRR